MVFVLIVIAAAIFFPRLTAILFVGPVLGFTLGTFLWAILALLDNSLVSLDTWLGFVGIAALASTLYALSDAGR